LTTKTGTKDEEEEIEMHKSTGVKRSTRMLDSSDSDNDDKEKKRLKKNSNTTIS
jgi:hypothetical protein